MATAVDTYRSWCVAQTPTPRPQCYPCPLGTLPPAWGRPPRPPALRPRVALGPSHTHALSCSCLLLCQEMGHLSIWEPSQPPYNSCAYLVGGHSPLDPTPGPCCLPTPGFCGWSCVLFRGAPPPTLWGAGLGSQRLAGQHLACKERTVRTPEPCTWGPAWRRSCPLLLPPQLRKRHELELKRQGSHTTLAKGPTPCGLLFQHPQIKAGALARPNAAGWERPAVLLS